MVLLLPARPSTGADTTRGQLGCLVEADGGAGRLLAATLVNGDPDDDDAPYVHAKVGIVDDRWLTIGSANLNEHSLFNDTEVNVMTTDPELARRTRCGCGRSICGCPRPTSPGTPVDVIDTLWRARAEPTRLRPMRTGGRPTAPDLAAGAVSRRSERLVGPVRGLLVDG